MMSNINEPSVANVLAVLCRASVEHISNGLGWYDRARTLAQTLEPSNVHRAAGIIAALSPNTSWPRNQALATQAYADGRLTGGTFKANVSKVNRMLAGEQPLNVLGGDKVRSFYLNIIGQGDDVITVDRHAHDIAVSEVFGNRPRPMLARKGGYDVFANIYRQASSLIGITPSQLQAITWLVWRDRLKVNEAGYRTGKRTSAALAA